jgi:hypothetical protein
MNDFIRRLKLRKLVHEGFLISNYNNEITKGQH